eukprot:2150500-Amphidinium_carterae.1
MKSPLEMVGLIEDGWLVIQGCLSISKVFNCCAVYMIKHAPALIFAGIVQDDIETLRNLVMNMSKSRTLVDVAKWPFFGGDQCDK